MQRRSLAILGLKKEARGLVQQHVTWQRLHLHAGVSLYQVTGLPAVSQIQTCSNASIQFKPMESRSFIVTRRMESNGLDSVRCFGGHCAFLCANLMP
jgi:hypothetical protein